MIGLSESLSTYVRRELKINDNRTAFTEQELASVSYISMSREDMNVIKYFKNLSVLSLEKYPSLTSDDIKYIGEIIPSIISLTVKEQNAIFNLDLSSYKNLIELAVIHNDNLIDIKGLSKVKRLTFYDNKEFKNIKHIVDYIIENPDCKVSLDFLYYISIKRENIKEEIFKNIVWVESLGLRSFVVHEYTDMEINYVMDCISRIACKYTYVTDDLLDKFSILYYWMIENIDFINEDDEKNYNMIDYNNTYKVFNSRRAGRLSYAKTFQMLLSYLNIDSYLVYSYGTLDSIGFYEGKKVYSLLGSSDYALLRVNIDGKFYYCDIAWDSSINNYKYADALRSFLLSKEELSLKHKFVGEGNVRKSYSFHGDDASDLVSYAKDRIQDVDEFFNQIDRLDRLILSLDVETSIVDNILASKDLNNTFKFDGEKKGLQLTIKSSQDTKKQCINQKEILIKKYEKELIKNYVGPNEDLKAYIQMLKDSYRISDSLYNVLAVL